MESLRHLPGTRRSTARRAWLLIAALACLWARPSGAEPSIDGAWQEIGPIARYGTMAVRDPVRDRMIVFGGIGDTYRGEVLTLPLGSISGWEVLQTTGLPPSPRADHSTIYDPVRDRVVVFGGTDGVTSRNDVWELALSGTPQWTQLAPTGTAPSPRARHTAIYDPVRDRMIVFGGAGTNGQAWSLEFAGGPHWTSLPAAGSQAGLVGHAAIYDPVGDRMLVFTTVNSNIMSLNLGGSPAWTFLATVVTRPSARDGATAIYDAARSRLIVAAGFAGNPLDDVHALDLQGTPVWGLLVPPGSLAAGRSRHAAIYDSARDRMVMFGGTDGSSARGEVLTLGLSGAPYWQHLAPQGLPPEPRSHHSAIYDPPRGRLLVFGGEGASAILGDVVALTLTGTPTWSQVATNGTPPGPRFSHSAIYDPVRDRMIVFGGSSQTSTIMNDVWALDLAGAPTWSPIYASGGSPAPRYAHSAVYDPVRDRMIIVGGQSSTTASDAWALTLSGAPAWQHLSTMPDGQPTMAVYDPVRDRLLLRALCDPYCGTLWELPLTGPPSWNPVATTGAVQGGPSSYEWTELYDPPLDRLVVYGGHTGELASLGLAGSPTWGQNAAAGITASRLWNYTATYDPERDQMVVFGGMRSASKAYTPNNDAWVISLAPPPALQVTLPEPASPTARWSLATAYDPPHHRMIAFGGFDGSYRNDLWELSLVDPPVWLPLAAAGAPPEGRAHHSAIYDPLRERMLFFGGSNGPVRFNDVWALSLGTSPAWSLLATSGTPPSPRDLHSAIHDPSGDRMIVFGGLGPGFSNDAYALHLATLAWEPLTPSGVRPAPRWAHSALYDPVRQRMVVFGGATSTNFNDAWELTLGSTPQWTLLATVGTPPAARSQHASIYDPVRDRMIVTGGGNPPGSLLFSDAWSLSLAGTPTWSLLDPLGQPPGGRRLSRSIYDAGRDRLVLFGGYDGDFQADTWTLTWGTPASNHVSPLADWASVTLGPGYPNPASESASIPFSLPRAAHVELRVHDVSGRLVQVLLSRSLPAGEHLAHWDRRGTQGTPVQPGVYFYELRAAGQRRARRVAVVD